MPDPVPATGTTPATTTSSQELPVQPAAPSPAPASAATPPAAPAAATQPATDGGNGDLQKELEAARKKIADFEKKQKDEDDAKLGEKERLEKQLREAQADARAGKVQVAAAKLGVTAPELVVKLLPDSVKDDGIEAGVAALIQQYPFLKGQPVGVTTPSASPQRKDDDKDKKFDPKNPTRLSGVFGK